MSSGLKVFVDGCDVSHDALPVRPLCVHHLIYVQSAFDAHTFCSLKSQGEVSPLLLATELLVGDMCRQVGVEHSAESQSIVPAAAEVCNVNVLITLSLLLTPLQQSVSLRASVLSGQS